MTNLKTKNNQKWQKIKLYGSLAAKELEKKYSSRLVGGAEMGTQVERIHSKVVARGLSKAAAGRAGGPTFVCR